MGSGRLLPLTGAILPPNGPRVVIVVEGPREDSVLARGTMSVALYRFARSPGSVWAWSKMR